MMNVPMPPRELRPSWVMARRMDAVGSSRPGPRRSDLGVLLRGPGIVTGNRRGETLERSVGAGRPRVRLRGRRELHGRLREHLTHPAALRVAKPTWVAWIASGRVEASEEHHTVLVHEVPEVLRPLAALPGWGRPPMSSGRELLALAPAMTGCHDGERRDDHGRWCSACTRQWCDPIRSSTISPPDSRWCGQLCFGAGGAGGRAVGCGHGLIVETHSKPECHVGRMTRAWRAERDLCPNGLPLPIPLNPCFPNGGAISFRHNF